MRAHAGFTRSMFVVVSSIDAADSACSKCGNWRKRRQLSNLCNAEDHRNLNESCSAAIARASVLRARAETGRLRSRETGALRKTRTTVTMTVQQSADALAQMKFAVGQPVARSEDARLVRGAGCYTADIDLPQQLYGVVLRSTHAHGVIRGVDTAAAAKLAGVQAIFTGADFVAADYAGLDCILNFQNRDGTPMRKAPRPALAADRVRFVGDPIASWWRIRPCRHATPPRRSTSTSSRCPPSPSHARPTRPARRNCTTTCRTMSGSTSISATASGRSGLRGGGACHQIAAAQQPHRRQPDRAARRSGRIRPRHGAFDGPCRQSGRSFGFRNYLAGVRGCAATRCGC